MRSGWISFCPLDRGRYRFPISAYGYQSQDKPVTYRVDNGPMWMGTKKHLVGYFDAARDNPTRVEFEDRPTASQLAATHPIGVARLPVLPTSSVHLSDNSRRIA